MTPTPSPHSEAPSGIPAGLLPLPHLPYHILLVLAEGEAHGWAIIKRIREIMRGHAPPSTGSLYLAMARLEEQGLLEEVAEPDGEESGDARRRYYGLTALGRTVLRAETLRLAELVALAQRQQVVDAEPLAAPGGSGAGA